MDYHLLAGRQANTINIFGLFFIKILPKSSDLLAVEKLGLGLVHSLKRHSWFQCANYPIIYTCNIK